MFASLNQIHNTPRCVSIVSNRLYNIGRVSSQTVKTQNIANINDEHKTAQVTRIKDGNQLFTSSKAVSMVLTEREPIVLSFNEMPGPKSLKYLSNARQYFSDIGTQITAGLLTVGLDIGNYLKQKKPLRSLTALFDEYGPVVRFVSPVGGDIVLLNHPDLIQKVYETEGEYPVRSALDSLERYRTEHRAHIFGGLYNVHGADWIQQRNVIDSPLHNAIKYHISGVFGICEGFTKRIYSLRNHRDEIQRDLYREVHKWAFDCMGLIMFSKKFTMLDTDLVYSQCDMSWLYHSLDKATDAILKCESGLQLWKICGTPSWFNLVRYCESLDNLIGKHVMEADQSLSSKSKEESANSLISAMLLGDKKMSAEDITTVLMDMLLVGVNSVSTSMCFLLYYLGKYSKSQKTLYEEIRKVAPTLSTDSLMNIKEETPYLQACIKETLRLVPPIPLLTRILHKNIVLDRYNVPQGTLIIMSTQDAGLKEGNYDDASKFCPERWLNTDAKDYHAFASIPFGFGARKCIGQNIAETMMTLLTVQLLQKYKLEYHYGDILPTRTFIARPNRKLKIRFIDRM